MSDMQSFLYVTYIRTTPEKLWQALTEPEFTRRYWIGTHQECDWKPGSSWRLVFSDGTLADTGEVVDVDPPKRLVLKWRNEFMPDLKAEGYTRCTFTLEPDGDVVKLTVLHEGPKKFVEAVSHGWPHVLSSLKSLLETGQGLPGTDAMPEFDKEPVAKG